MQNATVPVHDFVSYIMACCRKACELALAIREKTTLFNLLIEQKKENEKNARFDVDFKTLADVLIQEMLRHYLDAKFPGIGSNIFGEESNTFKNTHGRQITVCICAQREDTVELLGEVLNGNLDAARILAEILHETPRAEAISDIFKVFKNQTLPVSDLGIWIDPIDSTSEYIAGHTPTKGGDISTAGGLSNVTILIGGFHLGSGLPFAGVVCQPFANCKSENNEKKYSSRFLWGVHLNKSVVCEELRRTRSKSTPKLLVRSNAEDDEVIDSLHDVGYCTKSAPGAGYKFLCAIDNLADAYFLTKPQTFKWDSCAPHAILRALEGGVVSYKAALDAAKSSSNITTLNLDDLQLRYNEKNHNVEPGKEWCNMDGLIAYKDSKSLFDLVRMLN